MYVYCMYIYIYTDMYVCVYPVLVQYGVLSVGFQKQTKQNSQTITLNYMSVSKLWQNVIFELIKYISSTVSVPKNGSLC